MNLLHTSRLSSALLFTLFWLSSHTNAQVIDILCLESEGCGSYEGTTADGTYFTSEANPSLPATGTGVFEPFVRIQANGSSEEYDGVTDSQNGYNSDAGEGDINFDTKSSWTESVLFGDLGLIELDGAFYYLFALDSNEKGKGDSDPNLIDITDIQIYIGSDPDLAKPELDSGYTGTPFDSTDNSLLGLAPTWTLDQSGPGSNGDVTVTLQSSICDANGQCGSGHGDLYLYIPESYLIGSASDYLVFYTEYAYADSGFEEWAYHSGTTSIPEPYTIVLLASGLGLLALRSRSQRKS